MLLRTYLVFFLTITSAFVIGDADTAKLEYEYEIHITVKSTRGVAAEVPFTLKLSGDRGDHLLDIVPGVVNDEFVVKKTFKTASPIGQLECVEISANYQQSAAYLLVEKVTLRNIEPDEGDTYVAFNLGKLQKGLSELGDPVRFCSYESEEFWEPPRDGLCPSGEGHVNSDVCEKCSAGSYRSDWMPNNECFKCPPGSFSDEPGAEECKECEEGKTTMGGATKSDQCFDKQKILEGTFAETISIYLEVTGDLCQMRELLWDFSNFKIFDLQFTSCEVVKDITKMKLSLTLPSRFANEVWEIFQIAKDHLGLANAVIKNWGPFYAKKIFNLVNFSEDLSWLDLKMNSDVLKLDSIEIKKFEPEYKSHCSKGYYFGLNQKSQIAYCMPLPVTAESTSLEKSWLIKKLVVLDIQGSDNCMKGFVRLLFEHQAKTSLFFPLKCLTATDSVDACQTKFVSCRPNMDKKGSKLVLSISYNNEVITENIKNTVIDNTQLRKLADSVLTKSVSSTFEMKFVDEIDDCPGGQGMDYDMKGNMLCSDCGPGRFKNNRASCQRCPFFSYSKDGSCKSCDNGKVTPFWGMDSEAMCIDEQADYSGRNNMNLDLELQMDFCGIAQKKRNMDKKCRDSYGTDLDEEKLKDESPLEKMICFGSVNLKKVFDDDLSCSDFDSNDFQEMIKSVTNDDEKCELDEYGNKKDPDCDEIWERIREAICFAAKPMRNLEDLNLSELSNSCDALTDEDKTLTISLSIDEEINIEGSPVLIPMLTAFKQFENFDFSDLTVGAETIMKWIGIYDMNALTGMNIANDIRDMGMEMPNGISINKYDFDAEFKKDQFFCDNGKPKMECNEGCNTSCERKDRRKDGWMECRRDECNDCKESFFWKNHNDDNEYPYDRNDCLRCEFPENIKNGKRKHMWDSGAEYFCDPGYALRDCNSHAYCDNSTYNVKLPTCRKIPDSCKFNDVYGQIEKIRDFMSSNEQRCGAWASYKCTDPSREIEGSAWCDDYGYVYYPSCKDKCSFPDIINNGRKEREYVNDDGEARAEYKCNDGFRFKENSRRDAQCEKSRGKSEADLPTCVPIDTCTFPDDFDGKQADGDGWDEYKGDDKIKYRRYKCPDHMHGEGREEAYCYGDQVVSELKCFDQDKRCHYYPEIDGGRKIYKHGAVWYECHYGRKMEGEPRAQCIDGKGYGPSCVEQKDDCDLPDSIDGGWREEKWYNRARYRCEEGYRIDQGTSYLADCKRDDGTSYIPVCNRFTCDFKDTIEHGKLNRKEERSAYYECDDRFRFVNQSDRAWCEADHYDPENYYYPQCVDANIKCDFPIQIDNGVREEEGDYWARYRCNDEYRMEGNGIVQCNGKGEVTGLPKCKIHKKCSFPNDIKGGRLAENHDGDRARYECNDGFGMDGYAWVECNHETGEARGELPRCECHDRSRCSYDCELPAFIRHGQLIGTDGDWGRYECYPGYAMINAPKLIRQDYIDAYGKGFCEDGELNLPRCVNVWEIRQCAYPQKIDGGYLKTYENGTDGKQVAEYECHEGHRMITTTSAGNRALCRSYLDFSITTPRCVEEDDYSIIEFKLVNGAAKNPKMGYVAARKSKLNRKERNSDQGGWMTVCDDFVNDEGAGAICRSLGEGYKFGKKVSLPKKVKAPSARIGLTHIKCAYDDTFIESDTCWPLEHGTPGFPLCTSDEKLAVKCGKVRWSATITAWKKISGKFQQLFCKLKIIKEDQNLKINAADWTVLFVGFEKNDEGKMISAKPFVYQQAVKFSKTKGFNLRHKQKRFTCNMVVVLPGKKYKLKYVGKEKLTALSRLAVAVKITQGCEFDDKMLQN